MVIYLQNLLPDGARSAVHHWHNPNPILDNLRDVKDSEGYCARNLQRCVCEIQTRTNAPAKTETHRTRILLWLFALPRNVPIGVELRRVGIQTLVA
jgi:hypothetical protein